MLVISDAFIEAIETALKTGAAAPDLATCKVDLFTNAVTPTRQDAMSKYTLANFTGYTQLTLTPTGPYPDQINGPFLRSQLLAFQVGATPTVTNPTVYGYVIQDAGGAFVGAELFPSPPAPYPMVAPNTPLSFVAEMRLRDYAA